MKKLATLLAAAALLAVAVNAAFAANAVRISQAYGGGGGSGYYLYDYVELYNSTNAAVSVGGDYLEYGSATGNWGSSTGNIYQIPANTMIQPCSYLLIQLGAAGTAGAALPVTPDLVTANLSMSQSTGKVGLFTALDSNGACGTEAGIVVDKVAWGTSNCYEGTGAAGGTTNQSAVVRLQGGQTDNDNNAADFTVVTSPVPHNSASPANPNGPCGTVPTLNKTWGTLKSIYR